MTALVSTKPENYELWLQTLEGRLAPEQINGRLGSSDGGRCCLGVACDLSGVKADFDPTLPTILIWDGAENLLPTSVVRWLGLEVPHWVNSDEEGVWDLLLDLPDEVYMKDAQTPTLDRHLTASIMNDSGFTFKQIAQMIRYFGIKEVNEG